MIIKTDQDTIRPFLEDASGLTGAHTDKVFLAENTGEVSELLKECSSKNITVTVSGGGTGVTGGRLPFEGVVLATDRLNRILDLKPGSIVVQSGVPITEIHKAAGSIGYFYPPDATEWTAFIGGNIATNASGARTFKYGATRKYIKRIKVVLSNGDIIDVERGRLLAKSNILEIRNTKSEIRNKFEIPNYKIPNIKNAAGYYSRKNMDLIDLFIGSEGTLGVIAEAELSLLKKEGFVFACFSFFNRLNDALNFVAEAKKCDALAIEFFDARALDLLRTKYLNMPKAAACVFFEEEITTEKEKDYLERWGNLLEKHNVSLDDVWTSETPEKAQEFKDMRHSVPELVNEIVKKRGFPKLGTDIAVPDRAFAEMFGLYEKTLLSSNIDSLIFGHIGDNHLHVNMLPKDSDEAEKVKDIYISFVRRAISLGGTVSAEHGIGKIKHRFLKEMYGDRGILEMTRVKKSLDPDLILGLGNIFPKELL
ncbi:MAG: FAD-binding oxidoreductase [Candidatus Saganbacteria bacterium]|nr:FAD-binding oxidoreductase [Candidatus Saganbacteria bacterium]